MITLNDELETILDRIVDKQFKIYNYITKEQFRALVYLNFAQWVGEKFEKEVYGTTTR